MTYEMLQQYWWVLIAVLGGLLVFLFFVQGANSLIFRLGRDESEREMIVNATGRKWELTFTTLVVFGGAFFASFPLFYSTSFGGAYWVWMLLLFTFVLQAVSYEFQSKAGNLIGKKTFRIFLVLNGIAAPFLVGAAVATFFTGSEFIVDKSNVSLAEAGVISRWANDWHGLDALFNVWNWVLGFAVLFLSRVLGSLFLLNNVNEESFRLQLRHQVLVDTVPFLLFFLAFVGFVLTKDGFAVDATGKVSMEAYKYLHNLLALPVALVSFLVGVVLVLWGILGTILKATFHKGFWFAGIGSVLTVIAIFFLVGYNGTSYYPSTADLQSSLTIQNSSSTEFTLTVMSYVSLLIPFVLAYIAYVWRALSRDITKKELAETDHKY